MCVCPAHYHGWYLPTYTRIHTHMYVYMPVLMRTHTHAHMHAHMQCTLRVWDAFFNEGSKVLFRVALAILHIHEKTILAW